MRMGYLGLGMGLRYATPYIKWRSRMDVIENVALIAFLMFIGVSATLAVLFGLFYMLEVLDD